MELNFSIKPSKEKPPSQDVSRTATPLRVADAHFHPTNYTQQGTDPVLLLPAMDTLNIKYTTLCPIPTNVLARACGSCADDDYEPSTGHTTGEANYYIADANIRKAVDVESSTYREHLKQDAPLYYNTGVDADTAARYGELNAEQKNRFDPMITGLVLGDLRCSEDVLRKLKEHPGVFSGVGEITIHKEWVEEKLPTEHQAQLEQQRSAIAHLMSTCGHIGMPVILHCDVDVLHGRVPGLPAHLEGMKSFLANPLCVNTTIIWAHMGGLGKYSGISDGHLDRVRQILESDVYKHVHFDLSWDIVAKQLLRRSKVDTVDDEARVKAFCKLLTDHPKRFLFGSDALSPNTTSIWGATADLYSKVFHRLPDEVSRAVRYGNYERLIVGARPWVRAYEKFCLPYAMVLVDMRQDNERPPEVKKAIERAVQDGIEVGMALRLHEMKNAPIPPEILNLQARLMQVEDLNAIATSILDVKKPPPWETHAAFKKNYLTKH